MGTRNLTMVYLNGEYKVAQYGQWDGYPEATGCLILKFLTGVKLDYFKKAIEKVKEYTPEELAKIKSTIAMNILPNWEQFHPSLDRDKGCKILSDITFNGVQKVKNNVDFAGDSLFCEWAYVIDLDHNTFEIYKGFNKEKLTEKDRFYFLMKDGTEYYPVKLVASYNLDNLPPEDVFLKDFEEK